MISRVMLLISGFLLGISVVTFANNTTPGCDCARQCVANLIAQARQRAWIGVELQHLGSRVGYLEATRVWAESPALQAGIQKGDFIVGIGEATFKGMTDFEAIDALSARALANLTPGKVVAVQLERGPTTLTVQVTPVAYDRYSLAEFIGRRLMNQFPDVAYRP